MRLSTYGTGDLTRLTDEQRAAGQMRGQDIYQESRSHSAAVYSYFELLRALPHKVITFEIVISLAAIGRKEPLRRVFTLAGVECTNRAAFKAGEFCAVLGEVWHILNQDVGRTEDEVLSDQARTRNPPPLPRCPPCSYTGLTNRRAVCAPQHNVLRTMCDCSCAVVVALPFLLRTGDAWPDGLRGDMRELLGSGPLQPLPPPLWPRQLQLPSDSTLTEARNHALVRAERRDRAAAEWALQQRARLESARDTDQEDYVRGACTAAADEVLAASAWFSALKYDGGASLERVQISRETAWAARSGTQGPRLEQAGLRLLLSLGEDATDQVLAVYKLIPEADRRQFQDVEQLTQQQQAQLQQQLQQLQQQAQQ